VPLPDYSDKPMNESFAIITTCLDEDGFTYFVAVQHELCRIRVLSTKGSIKL
jgi:hypothetical protein